MKTTIIPAQITTVEDKIAGNLSLTQVIILMLPVFFAGFIYVALSPRMGFALYKVFLILPVLLIAFILSLRIEDKLVVNWLVLLLRYNIKPKYYVFNKNDGYMRELYLPNASKKTAKAISLAKSKRRVTSSSLGIKEQIAFEKDNENIRFKANGKGGMNVIFNQIQK